MRGENLLVTKSENFAIRIINLGKYLQKYPIIKSIIFQLLRSGTSIGANIAESQHAESRLDFIHKLFIAYKESNETSYWLKILNRTQYLTNPQYISINNDCIELNKLLSAILTKTKNNCN